MVLDVHRLRADTPGCERVVHLNNAGASLLPRPVFDAVMDHLRLESEVGGYEAADAAADRLDATRSALGRLLGADPLDIAITQSDTASWSKAFWGLALSGWFDDGGRVLVDRIAYSSHYLSLLQAVDRFGVRVEAIDSLDDGTIDLGDLDRRLDASVRMVAVTHVGTHRGLVNPVADVGARTRTSGTPFFLDACQSAGQLPVDAAAIGCDVATGTGRKFLRAPRGTGWLYVRPEWAERMAPPGIDNVSARWTAEDRYEYVERAGRFEEFERSIAGEIGLGVAVEYALALGIDAITQRIGGLAERLRAGLASVGASVHDGGQVRCSIVTFTVPRRSPVDVRASLAEERINVTVTEGNWSRLDMPRRGLDAAVRASPHAFNTEEEVDRLVEHVRKL